MPEQRTRKKLWAYAYQFAPPQTEDRLRAVGALLDRERAVAKVEERTWEGRFLGVRLVTHILVVTDLPDQDREVNDKLAAALQELDAPFSVTLPLAVVGDDPVAPPE